MADALRRAALPADELAAEDWARFVAEHGSAAQFSAKLAAALRTSDESAAQARRGEVPGDTVEDPVAWYWEKQQAAVKREVFGESMARVMSAPDARPSPVALAARHDAFAADLSAELLRGLPPQLALPLGADGPPGALSPRVPSHNCSHVQDPPKVPGILVQPPTRPPMGDRYPAASWLGQVERLTEETRERRRQAFQAAADDASKLAAWAATHPDEAGTMSVVREGERVDVPVAEGQLARAKWYTDRARGQHLRFERLRHCGEGGLRVVCGAPSRSSATGCCGWAKAISVGCAARRLCIMCRERAAARDRRVFDAARASVLQEAGARGWLRHNRDGGRYTEKHLGLTIPDGHVTGPGAATRRIELLFAAWRPFVLQLQKHLRLYRRCRACGADRGQSCREGSRRVNVPHHPRREVLFFWRGFEWTGGFDGAGHPHFHVWIYCPFLPPELLRYWWAMALQRLGVDVFGPDRSLWMGPHGGARAAPPMHLLAGSIPEKKYVNVDVREVTIRRVEREVSYFPGELIKGAAAIKLTKTSLKVVTVGGQDLQRYIGGWIVSDRDSNGNVVSPAVMAEVFDALENRKQIRASDGFVARGRRACRCPQCDARGWFKTSIVPWHAPDRVAVRAAWGLPPIRSPDPPGGPSGPGLRKADRRDAGLQARLAIVG